MKSSTQESSEFEEFYSSYCEYIEQGDYETCLQKCDEFFASQQDNNQNKIQKLSLIFNVYILTSNFDQCLSIAEQAVKIEETDFTLNLLSTAYLEQNKFQEALEHLNRAIQLAPNKNYLLYLNQSTAFIFIEKFKEGIEAGEKFLKLLTLEDDSNKQKALMPKYNKNMAFAHYMLGNNVCALKFIQNYFEFNSKDIAVKLLHGYIWLHLKEYDQAIKCFEEILDIESEDFNFSVRKGMAFAILYQNKIQDAEAIFEQLHQINPRDMSITIALFDIYHALATSQSLAQANKLLLKSSLNEVVGKIPSLKENYKNTSCVTVYIWNPKHDRKPPNFQGTYKYSDADYGHAAIKINYQDNQYYFSWFPSGEDYENKPGYERATPTSYGESKRITGDNHCKEWIFNLYQQNLPDNWEKQIKYMSLRTADKIQFLKSATFKIRFWSGINVERMLDYFRALYKSDAAYDVRKLNCCDVVLNALQVSLDETVDNVSEIKTSKMKKYKNYNKSDILNAFRYQLSHQYGTKSTTIYKYCHKLGTAINNNIKRDDELPSVIISFNRWNKTQRTLTKFDFDPAKFDPNWFTTTKKISLSQLFDNLIIQKISSALFNAQIQDMPEEKVVEFENDNNVYLTISDDVPQIEVLHYQPMPGDQGHCLYHAVGIFLGKDVSSLRQEVASRLEENISNTDIINVIFGLLPEGETPASYIQAIRNNKEWADNIEITTLMKIFNRPIVIIGQDYEIINLIDIQQYLNCEPIFVYYNGYNHYDAYLLTGNATSQDILSILLAQQNEIATLHNPLTQFNKIIEEEGIQEQELKTSDAKLFPKLVKNKIKEERSSEVNKVSKDKEIDAQQTKTQDYYHSSVFTGSKSLEATSVAKELMDDMIDYSEESEEENQEELFDSGNDRDSDSGNDRDSKSIDNESPPLHRLNLGK